MVLGSGTPGEYSSILLNPSKDFIPLSDTTNENDLKSTAKNVIDRIKTSKFIFYTMTIDSLLIINSTD